MTIISVGQLRELLTQYSGGSPIRLHADDRDEPIVQIIPLDGAKNEWVTIWDNDTHPDGYRRIDMDRDRQQEREARGKISTVQNSGHPKEEEA